MSAYPSLSLYINGQFLSGEGRKTQDVFNPANQQVIGQLPHASKAGIVGIFVVILAAFLYVIAPPIVDSILGNGCI